MADNTVQALPGQQIIDIVLPTYRMEPEEDERFYPSNAKKIADKIVADELANQAYDEEEAKYWGLNISDKVREAVHGKRIDSRKTTLHTYLTIHVFCDYMTCSLTCSQHKEF